MRKMTTFALAGTLAAFWGGHRLLQAAGFAKLCFDAEYARDVEAPMKVVKKQSKNWSGEGYVEVPEEAGKTKGSATYTINVTSAGNYYVWARTYWKDGCGNSVGVQIDEYSPAILGQDGTYNHWHWVEAKGAKFKLSAGKHTLKLLNREDGIMVDQVFLTQDDEYVPEGIRPATQKPS